MDVGFEVVAIARIYPSSNLATTVVVRVPLHSSRISASFVLVVGENDLVSVKIASEEVVTASSES